MALEYFCCFHSYGRKLEKLSDQEVGRLFRALMKYSATGEHTELTGRESIAYDFIADDIDRSKQEYDRRCEKNRENIAKRYEDTTVYDRIPSNTTVYESYQTKSKTKTKSKTNDANASIAFRKPTAEEIKAYCAENGYSVDADAFIDHYESNGWKIGGRSAMKDWKAAVRNWSRNGYGKGKAKDTMVSHSLDVDQYEEELAHYTPVFGGNHGQA